MFQTSEEFINYFKAHGRDQSQKVLLKYGIKAGGLAGWTIASVFSKGLFHIVSGIAEAAYTGYSDYDKSQKRYSAFSQLEVDCHCQSHPAIPQKAPNTLRVLSCVDTLEAFKQHSKPSDKETIKKAGISAMTSLGGRKAATAKLIWDRIRSQSAFKESSYHAHSLWTKLHNPDCPEPGHPCLLALAIGATLVASGTAEEKDWVEAYLIATLPVFAKPIPKSPMTLGQLIFEALSPDF